MLDQFTLISLQVLIILTFVVIVFGIPLMDLLLNNKK